MNPLPLLVLTLAHLITDTAQGAVPALLPMLKQSLGLSYAMAGAIIMTMNLTSSVIQPIFGYLTDRWRLHWLIPLGVALSGLGCAAIGLAPTYAAVLLAVVVSGLGVASFHPESFKAVLSSAGQRKVTAVSWFMVGGNLGMALGPILVTAYVAWWGGGGTLLYALPALAMAGLLWTPWGPARKAIGRSAAGPAIAGAPQPLGRRWGPLGLLILAVVLRSWVHSGVAAYMPFYFLTVLGGDPLEVGSLLTTFLLAGVAGTLLGAPVAERVGPKKFFVASVAVVTPMLVWCLHVGGDWLFLPLALSGVFLLSTWSVVMVMAQQILPDRAGMASGLMAGFAIGSGGVGAAALGLVADLWGVTAVLQIVAVLPLLSAAAAAFIPLAPAAGQTK